MNNLKERRKWEDLKADKENIGRENLEKKEREALEEIERIIESRLEFDKKSAQE